MKKRLIIAIALLVLFTTYKPQDFYLGSKFNIEKIIIENNFILKKEDIKKDLIYIYDTNLFLLNTKLIKKSLAKQSFIESFEVKKIYPNKLKIKIFEKKPIAILLYKKNKFYFTANRNVIDYQDIKQYENLPIVYGNKEHFEKFYNDLKKINFSINQIKKFYYFESKRWDLLTHKNQIIKLPIKDYILSLENFSNLSGKNNFDKYQIFDYRIKDQLILK